MAVTPLTVRNWVRPNNGSTVQDPAPETANVSGGGNSFPNDGRVVVEIFNTTTSATTVTLDITKTVAGAPAVDPVISLANTIHQEWIGPFPPEIYGDTIVLTASANTVKFNVWHMP